MRIFNDGVKSTDEWMKRELLLVDLESRTEVVPEIFRQVIELLMAGLQHCVILYADF